MKVLLGMNRKKPLINNMKMDFLNKLIYLLKLLRIIESKFYNKFIEVLIIPYKYAIIYDRFYYKQSSSYLLRFLPKISS